MLPEVSFAMRVYRLISAVSNVEWDAVELPSQFMENWCYDRPTLYGFAKHYETGAPLPEELYQKLKDSKNFQAGMQMLRQLYFGITDMRIHAAYNPFMDEDNKVSPFDIQREAAKKYTVLSPLPNDRFLCSFSHIFAGEDLIPATHTLTHDRRLQRGILLVQMGGGHVR